MSNNNKIRIFISTGEVSGDMQGALLIDALYRQAAAQNLELEIAALGGEKMAAAGAYLVGNTVGIGAVGLVESLPYVVPTLQVQAKAKKYLWSNPPDVLVAIDYMGPNLGICGYVRRYLPLVPIVYYIAPQEWVWSLGGGNTTKIVANCDRLLAIFPQEARYYQEKGANVQFVGHPLIEEMATVPNRHQARQILGIPPEQLTVVLLPASRQQEVKYLLPVMVEAAKRLQTLLPQIHFWIPVSLEKYRQPIAQAINQAGLRATLLSASEARMAISAADLAICKSGTVNLEIALLNVPQVVIYRVSHITAWIAQHILKFSIPFMSPPNLVLEKAVVPELLQNSATADNICQESLDLLQNASRRQQIWADYQEMRQHLGEILAPVEFSRASPAQLAARAIIASVDVG